MWILRYLILATRQRSNALLDRRTRMTFDPLHGCPMHVCADKAEWDRRGKEQVAQMDSELRMDIEAYNRKTQERRVIAGEMIEVRPVVLEKQPDERQAFKEFLGATAVCAAGAEEETILPEAAPETEAAPAPTGDALVSSGVEAQAEAEPGADPTPLTEELLQESAKTEVQSHLPSGAPSMEPEAGPSFAKASDGALRAEAAPEPLEVPAPAPPTVPATPKPKTKREGKAGKK